ncbi:ATP-dependent Clp protease proteolytic subunit [Striga asiatica]|uniref:ATP-dependent Clp protease proteolytic subunit n=1 Tax=Striga asiatica TaxID=4170 RepID=A0A5A7R6J5_STRAF|nr:ATP-dependent Clp protease proteolytic subunit [Striga asiatica]
MRIAVFRVEIILLNKSSQHIKSKLRAVRITGSARLPKARAAPSTPAADNPPSRTPGIYVNAPLLPFPQPQERQSPALFPAPFAVLLFCVRGPLAFFVFAVISLCLLFIGHQNPTKPIMCPINKSLGLLAWHPNVVAYDLTDKIDGK